MTTFHTLLLVLHVVIGAIIVVLVLLQREPLLELLRLVQLPLGEFRLVRALQLLAHSRLQLALPLLVLRLALQHQLLALQLAPLQLAFQLLFHHKLLKIMLLTMLLIMLTIS